MAYFSSILTDLNSIRRKCAAAAIRIITNTFSTIFVYWSPVTTRTLSSVMATMLWKPKSGSSWNWWLLVLIDYWRNLKIPYQNRSWAKWLFRYVCLNTPHSRLFVTRLLFFVHPDDRYVELFEEGAQVNSSWYQAIKHLDQLSRCHQTLWLWHLGFAYRFKSTFTLSRLYCLYGGKFAIMNFYCFEI